MEKISYVACPKCQRQFYVERADFAARPEAISHCPFCSHEFPVREGNPHPPL